MQRFALSRYGLVVMWRYNGTSKVDFQERTAELNSGSPKPIGNISSFGEDASGEVYVCALADGEIYKIIGLRAELTISDPTLYGDAFIFHFNAVPGQSYTVEQSESLAPANWQTFTNVTTSADTTEVAITDALSSAQRFYRVRTP